MTKVQYQTESIVIYNIQQKPNKSCIKRVREAQYDREREEIEVALSVLADEREQREQSRQLRQELQASEINAQRLSHEANAACM